MDRVRPMTAFAQLDRSHDRHHERLDGLLGATERLATGVGGMTDVEEALDALAFFARSVPRHFGDEDEVVFPALARLRPDVAPRLAALSDEHAPMLAGFAALDAQLRGWDERVPAPPAAVAFATAAATVAASYRDHARREDALFAEVGSALGDEDAALLAALDARRGGGGGGGGGGGRRR